jgi:hypothetical protein
VAIVVDFAWTKPSVAQLHAWGAAAIGMYVSRDPAKNATKALVEEYAAAGIKTFLFFEDAGNQALKGYAQGKADAELAKTQAAALGKPPWAPIVFACDFDIPDFAPASQDPAAKLGHAADYFKAVNDVLGLAETGGYGGYWGVSRLAAAHLITCGVQTVAWSGGKVDTQDIVCLQNGQMLDNGNVDVETIESANLLARLAWVPGEAAPGSHPVLDHPVDAAWVSKGMLPLAGTGGLAAGVLRSDVATVLGTTLKHTGPVFGKDLAAYLDVGNLATTRLPAGTVVWYPKMVPA